MTDRDMERMVEAALLRREVSRLNAKVTELEAKLAEENDIILEMSDVMTHRMLASQEAERLAWLVLDKVREATP